jgi:hypothetical protein
MYEYNRDGDGPPNKFLDYLHHRTKTPICHQNVHIVSVISALFGGKKKGGGERPKHL